MAAAIEDRTADANTWSKTSRITSVEIVHDLAAAEAIWRSLEGAQASFTPYQRFDFLKPWQHQVGAREGLAPFIVIAFDAHRRPLLLLPLALRHAYGARCASFMGGKHSTFNMALWDHDFAASATSADLDGLVEAISQRAEADVLALHQQPARWRDLPNPLALLPHQPSANDCPMLTMVPGAALVSNVVPAPPQGQGTQAAGPSGLPQSRCVVRGRHHPAAGLVLSHQAAADGRTETAQCVRRSRHREFRPQRLHDAN